MPVKWPWEVLTSVIDLLSSKPEFLNENHVSFNRMRAEYQ